MILFVYLLKSFHADVAKALLNFFEKSFVLSRSYVKGKLISFSNALPNQ